MALHALIEGYRTPGFTPKSGEDLLAGQPVQMDTAASNVKLYVGPAASEEPLGIVLETTKAFSDPSKFTDLVNKGGLVSTQSLGIVEVFDDSRGALFDGSAFALNKPVYWDAAAKKYTATAAANLRVGLCLGVPSGASGVLRMKLEI